MIDKLTDLLVAAKREGSERAQAEYLINEGIVIPPCKIGSIVYVITIKRPCSACGFCTDFCHKDCTFSDRHDLVVKRAIVSSIEIAERCEVHMVIEGDETVREYKYICRFEDFGKTVFKTEEQANIKLKEGALNG